MFGLLNNRANYCYLIDFWLYMVLIPNSSRDVRFDKRITYPMPSDTNTTGIESAMAHIYSINGAFIVAK